jgi:hypothetical protein
MAGLIIGKRDGRWFVRAQGCCGSPSSMYDRAHAVQVLGEGGTLAGWDAQGFELRDRRGRAHRYPRGWSPRGSSLAASSSSAAT